MEALLTDLERSGPESLGSPLRAVAVLVRDVAELDGRGEDTLSRRRRRAAAARVARRAASLAGQVDAALNRGPKPDDGYRDAVVEVGVRAGEAKYTPDPALCLRALARVADFALRLPPGHDGDDWELGAMAFGDEDTLEELRDAALELAVAAFLVAGDP